jgi:hypothetical protein
VWLLIEWLDLGICSFGYKLCTNMYHDFHFSLSITCMFIVLMFIGVGHFLSCKFY